MKSITDLEELKDKAFSGPVPEMKYLKEIKKGLQKIPKNQRTQFQNFIIDLKQSLFERSVIFPGLNLDEYLNKPDEDINSSEKIVDSLPVSTENKAKNESQELEFDDLLKKLLTCLEDTLFNLKGYAVLKLSSQGNDNFKIKVLYESNYYFEPIENKISKTFEECDSESIDSFNKRILEGYTPDSNLLCLLLISTKINNQEEQEKNKEALNNITDCFDQFEHCYIDSVAGSNSNFYKRIIDKEEFFNELKYTTSKFLSNGKISYEEEKIIKKCFHSSSSPVLVYKLLKEGNSGAKVIEVRQIQPFTSKQYEQRYIIKFSKKDKQRKLQSEHTQFTDFIESYEGFKDYKCTLFETPTHVALQYVYAKSVMAKESYSFATIIDKENNKFHYELPSKIEALFDLELFDHWSGSEKKKLISTRELYSRYVRLEKIKKEVLLIEGISDEDFQKTDFNKNLQKLLNHKIETNLKICHGDLHSENFFVDDKEQLFLIDFGFTNSLHSVIDFTSLECSLKFRHIPRYIEMDILLEAEKELLSDNTFDESYRFKSIASRNDLLRLYDAIKTIRIKSKHHLHNQGSMLEYYISLFFMTYRQVRYREMNQLYALKTAKILLEKIIVDLGL